MDAMLGALVLGVAALAAAVMGFAIQRGATCTVAAVEEVLLQRKGTRLSALVEASVWVALGLALAQQLHWLEQAPAGFTLSVWTVVGASLLGLGAFVNRACVFGAIAHLGSGDWAYAATPLGFYAGCLSVRAVFSPPMPRIVDGGSVALGAAGWVISLQLVFLAWRILWPLRERARNRVSDAAAPQRWSPRLATIVIGFTFLVTLLLAGAWAYTDVLADLARGMAHSLPARIGLALALLCGALIGGKTAGLLRLVPVTGAALARCFAGGVLMGWGSLLIPGGNDGLILVGMPLLWPYAWVAFATMCLTIASALYLQQTITARRSP